MQEFITTWDNVLTGLAKGPDDTTLQALLLRNLRQCKAMEQDIAHNDRKASNDPEKSYNYLMLRPCSHRSQLPTLVPRRIEPVHRR